VSNHLLWMIVAEVRKVFSRGVAMLALGAAALVPLLVLGVMWELRSGGPSVNGQDVGTMVTYSAVEVGSWSLNVRNFLVLPLFLGLATAMSVAGELNDRTLREVLVRPVSRGTVLFVRVAALGLLSAATLVVTAAVALGVGLVAFGLPAPPVVPEGYPSVGALLGGYAVSFLCDLGIILLVMLVSLLIRSVGITLVVLVLGWGADFLLRKLLGLLQTLGVASAGSLLPWTPGNALDCWEGWSDGFEWQRFVALATVMVLSALASVVRFRRLDVP
jgi:ABC-type transport system involved in multi-copper enzyme maturation permease subunit